LQIFPSESEPKQQGVGFQSGRRQHLLHSCGRGLQGEQIVLTLRLSISKKRKKINNTDITQGGKYILVIKRKKLFVDN